MEKLKVFMDTIRVSVNQSGVCNKVVETNDNDVAIVFIIAVASLIALLILSVFTYCIVKMKKHEGIKTIVKEIIEEKDVKCDVITPIVEKILREKKASHDGIKAIVEKLLEDKDKQNKENGK